jgi:uncharacterized protein YndB with AHSA1/START domain
MSTQHGFATERVIAAVPDRVFGALTTVDGLAGWWTPAVSGKADPGGEITFSFGDERIVMWVDEVERPRRVAWSCRRHTKFPDWDGTRLTFDLHPASEDHSSTSLVFEHAGLVPKLDCFSLCSAGWDHYLASLAAYAAGGRGVPWRTAGWRPAAT